MPRIALLGTRGIPAQYGGFETFCERLAIGLVKEHIDVCVYREASEWGWDEFRGVTIRCVPALPLGPFKTILFDALCLVDAASRRYDVVYMLGYGASVFLWLPKLLQQNLWVNMDGLEWKRRKWSWPARMYLRCAEWIAYRSADLVVVDAIAIGASLEARHGGRQGVVFVPYGADVLEKQQLGDEPVVEKWGGDDFYLIVARIEPENHVREMLEGFCGSASQKKLVVVGPLRRDGYSRSIERFADDRRVLFLGGVYDQTTLRALRMRCFAYIHGHSVGGTNPSLLEAMGAGNLILAHRNPFNREVLGTDECMFADAAGLSRLIEQVEGDSWLLQREVCREAVRARLLERYTWDMVIEKYKQLLVKWSHAE
ncbi:MAG: DUF1972 domain-containing protein [Ktedonobacteraceae bacterium]